jgi:hypothetical protein
MALTVTVFIFNLYQFINIFQSHPIIMPYMTDYFGSLINLVGPGGGVLIPVIQGV